MKQCLCITWIGRYNQVVNNYLRRFAILKMGHPVIYFTPLNMMRKNSHQISHIQVLGFFNGGKFVL